MKGNMFRHARTQSLTLRLIFVACWFAPYGSSRLGLLVLYVLKRP